MNRPNPLLTVLALTLACAAGCHAPNHAAQRAQTTEKWNEVRADFKLQLARELFDDGLLEETQRECRDILRIEPKNAPALELLAEVQVELGKSASAIKTIQTARASGADSPMFDYLTGVVHEQRGHAREAAEAYLRAVKRDPSRFEFLSAAAEALVALDKPQWALELLRENEHACDRAADLARLEAHLLARSGDRQEAARAFDRASSGSGAVTVTALARADQHIRTGEFRQAIALLEPLMKDPEFANLVRRDLGMCYLQTGRSADALDRLRAATASADTADAQRDRIALVEAALLTGDLVTAGTTLETLRTQRGSAPDIARLRAAYFWKRGRHTLARDLLYDLLAANPDDIDAQCLLGEVLTSMGNSAGARETFEQALQLDPTSAWARQAIAAIARNQPKQPNERDPNPADPASTTEPARLTNAGR